jgi:type I restriction enzyme, S subunit
VNTHWPTRRLGEIFEIARGGSPRPIEKYITDDPNGLNWIKIGDATASGKFIEATKEKIRPEGLSKTRFVNTGDFVLTNSMSFGRPYIMATDGCIHDGWLVLKPQNQSLVYQDYFYHLLGSDEVYKKLAARASGSTVKNLNTAIVSTVEIVLPPLDEQRRIAAILDRADALRRKRKQALELSNSLERSIFLEMFGSPESNPKGWKWGQIGDLLQETQYGTSERAGEKGKYPILRMGNITSDGRISFEDLKYIDLNDKDLDKFTLRRGDILFNRTNSSDLVGKTAVFDRDETFAFAGYLVRARARDGVSPHYISGYLNSRHGKATLRSMAKSIVGMANINAKEMQSIPILVPDMHTQRAYAKKLVFTEAYRRQCKLHMQSLDAVFSSLQSRAFSGQL